jgi:hypothetical protein
MKQEEMNKQWVGLAKNMSNAWLSMMEHWNNNQRNTATDGNNPRSSAFAAPFAFFPYKSAIQSLFKFTKIGVENQFAFFNLFRESFSMDAFEKMYPHLTEDWYKELSRNMRDNFSPLLKVFNAEKLMSYNRQLINKQMDLMRLVSASGISAMEDYAETMQEDLDKFKSPEDLYNAWCTANEKAFAELLHSEQYIQLQEQLQQIREEFQEMFSQTIQKAEDVMQSQSAQETAKTNGENGDAAQVKRDKKQERQMEAARH